MTTANRAIVIRCRSCLINSSFSPMKYPKLISISVQIAAPSPVNSTKRTTFIFARPAGRLMY